MKNISGEHSTCACEESIFSYWVEYSRIRLMWLRVDSCLLYPCNNCNCYDY